MAQIVPSRMYFWDPKQEPSAVQAEDHRSQEGPRAPEAESRRPEGQVQEDYGQSVEIQEEDG